MHPPPVVREPWIGVSEVLYACGLGLVGVGVGRQWTPALGMLAAGAVLLATVFLAEALKARR